MTRNIQQLSCKLGKRDNQETKFSLLEQLRMAGLDFIFLKGYFLITIVFFTQAVFH